MSRIVPSPDWFIGIDSFDLCVNGNWLDSITIEVSETVNYPDISTAGLIVVTAFVGPFLCHFAYSIERLLYAVHEMVM
jgi:hypothetical protein